MQGKTTTEPDSLRQLWRIDYVKNGYYTIRPLYRMDYCLSYDSSTGGVSIRAVGDVYEVSDVTSDVKWNIYFHNGGYVFQHYDHSSHTMYPAGSGTAAGTSITTGTYAGSNSTFRWTLENGGSPMGALLHDTANGTLATTSTVKYVECGQTVSPAQLNLYPSYYADGEYCFEPNWLSSNPNVASVNIYTGQITAHAPGTATITLSMMEDYSGEEFICRYTLVVGDIALDNYGIRNLGSQLYAKANEDEEDSYILQAKLTSKSLQTWNIALAEGGYYTIELGMSEDYSSGYYLGAEGTTVKLYSNTSTNATKWMFVKIDTDTFKIIPKNGESSGYVLAVSSDDSGASLITKTYSANSNFDVWEMIRFLPTSGGEVVADATHWPPLDPLLQSNAIYNRVNCYGYAIDNQLDAEGKIFGIQQPGKYNDKTFSLSQSDCHEEPQKLLKAVEDDFNKFGEINSRQMIFTKIGRYEQCPTGTYKVALVIAPNVDYHWYRQDPDGFWSHKFNVIGGVSGEVRTTDASGNLIIDPQTADRNEANNYTLFIDYYAVTPWSQYYDFYNDYLTREVTLEDIS